MNLLNYVKRCAFITYIIFLGLVFAAMTMKVGHATSGIIPRTVLPNSGALNLNMSIFSIKKPTPKVPLYSDTNLIVTFENGTTHQEISRIEQTVGAHQKKQFHLPGVYLLTVAQGTVTDVQRKLQGFASVKSVELDTVAQVSATPNDTYFTNQWAYHNTGQTVNYVSGTASADESAPLAWDVTTGSSSIVIAETDTGVDYSHPDLSGNIWSNPGGIGGCSAGTHGYNILNASCDPMDDDTVYGGHGTHVAGILGATGNNSTGVTGVNWTTKILPIKWVSAYGVGYTSDLLSALDWILNAKSNGVNIRVVNDSTVFLGTAYSQTLSDEIDTLGSNGILFVTAAGNTGHNNDDVAVRRYPCGYDRPSEICVAASDQNDNLPSWANYGLHTVDLAAPGDNIYSTLPSNSYGYINGSSMASPQVAGAAALILSVQDMTPTDLKSDILNNVDPIASMNGLLITGGRLNICKALPGCKKPILVDNSNNSSTLTNYQIAVHLDTATLISQGKMRSDCGDIRFTDSDNTTAISNYWVENCNSADTKVWVKVPSIPASSAKTIYISYGNASLTSLSSATNTFVNDISNAEAIYHMDEASGTNVTDSTGNGFTGTAAGSPTPSVVTGKFGNGRNWNGSGGYISLANESSLPYGTNAKSVCAWANTASTAAGTAQLFNMGTTTTDHYFGIGRNGTSLVGFGWNDDITASSFWSTNSWNFVCLTWDGTNAKLYANGNTTPLTTGTPSWNTVDSGAAYIGNDIYNNVWNGSIDDVSVYSKALSANETADLYNNYAYATSNDAGHMLVRKISSPEPTVFNGISGGGPASTAYKRTVTIDNSTNSNTLTNYQVAVTLDTATLISQGKMHADCRDIRFNDSDDSTAITDYWVENCNDSSSKVWVKVPSITASTTYHIYLYYGSTTATPLSSTTNTFVSDIDNVKAMWHMDEASGTNVGDATGNGYSGTAAGSPTPSVTTGQFGNGRNWTGSGGYISVANESSLPFGTNPRSVCGWANTSTTSGTAEIFDMGTDSTNQHFGIGRSGSNLTGFGWNNDFSYSSFWSTNAWHFVCLTYDGTTETLYADGSSVATATLAWNTVDGGGTYIGNDIPNYYWSGALDDISFYAKKLSSSEVSDLYSNYGYTTGNYLGHILVRKIVNNEPTISIGSESGV